MWLNQIALSDVTLVVDVEVAEALALDLFGGVDELQLGRPGGPLAEPPPGLRRAGRVRQGGVGPGQVEVAGHLERLVLGVDVGEVDHRDPDGHGNPPAPLAGPVDSLPDRRLIRRDFGPRQPAHRQDRPRPYPPPRRPGPEDHGCCLPRCRSPRPAIGEPAGRPGHARREPDRSIRAISGCGPANPPPSSFGSPSSFGRFSGDGRVLGGRGEADVDDAGSPGRGAVGAGDAGPLPARAGRRPAPGGDRAGHGRGLAAALGAAGPGHRAGELRRSVRDVRRQPERGEGVAALRELPRDGPRAGTPVGQPVFHQAVDLPPGPELRERAAQGQRPGRQPDRDRRRGGLEGGRHRRGALPRRRLQGLRPHPERVGAPEHGAELPVRPARRRARSRSGATPSRWPSTSRPRSRSGWSRPG